jgi:predicted O-linked N-acetylglucosamine transferase (SPINDLY family)
MADAHTVYTQATAQIALGALDVIHLIGAADQLNTLAQPDLALTLYQQWLAAHPTHPLAYVAAFNAGAHLLQRNRPADARPLLEQASQLSPRLFAARQNLSMCLEQMGETGQAIAELHTVVEQLAEVNLASIQTKVTVLKNLARIQRRSDPTAAAAALGQALEIAPYDDEIAQHWIHSRQETCVWPVLKPIGVLQPSQLLRTMFPLAAAAFSGDALLQLATAWRYTNKTVAAAPLCQTLGDWPVSAQARPEKIRIGYLSSDFCNHAIGYLISDIFAFHDRSRYDITVFNLSPPTHDATQEKIRAQVDHWVELNTVSDAEAARRILERGIHILLDMNGHTNYQRPRLLAMQPAPVMANWLGYPGTMGSQSHHYIIADEVIIPPTHERYYSEQVLRLPCYQPNGPLMAVPAAMKTRAELGLPEQAVVYCCFNGAIKITPSVFERWMTTLREVSGSVLWLRGAEAQTQARLQASAVAYGVAAERVVFLPFCSNTEYLSYHRHADIFLDTFPYGAHTTASDALRMGVPIVTLRGQSFASRVCASLSHAAGLDDLVCDTPAQYLERSIRLGQDAAWRSEVRQRLQAALPGCTLFDARKLTTHLEGLFETMWQAHTTGQLPQPQMPDLDQLFAEAVRGADHGRDLSAFAGL